MNISNFNPMKTVLRFSPFARPVAHSEAKDENVKVPKLPTRGSDSAAGYDVYSPINVTIKAHTRYSLGLGISFELVGKIPNEAAGKPVVKSVVPKKCLEQDDTNPTVNSYGYYLQVHPRSGLAVKQSIDIGAGVIDLDYRGELGVCLINNGDADWHIKAGDRVAQLVLHRIYAPETEWVESHDEMSVTDRNQGGYGSTGT